jgi:hypothetical protein
VVPRAGKPPLIAVFTFQRQPSPLVDEKHLVVRSADLRWTAEFAQLRLDMGLPPAFF